MFGKSRLTKRRWLIAGVLAISFACTGVVAQQAHPANTSAPVPPSQTSSTTPRFRPSMSVRARDYYQLIWGVDSLTVRSVESGELIRFNFRVTDATKAQPLNDKKLEPFLIDEQAGVKLIVPSLEKVGQLRQSGTPENGKVYWMAFSNKGRHVKPGDRVSIVIGKFRADDLLVE